MGYEDFKNSARRTSSDEIFRHKASNTAKNLDNDRCQYGLASMVYKCFDRKNSDSDIKNEKISDQQLTEKLHKPIIITFHKRKVH